MSNPLGIFAPPWVQILVKYRRTLKNGLLKDPYKTLSLFVTHLQDVIAAMMERERELAGTADSFSSYSNSLFHNNYLRLKKEFTNAGMPCLISDSGYFLVTDYSQREFEFQKEPEFINSESAYDLKMVRAIRNNFGMVAFPLTFFCPAFLRRSFQKYLRVSICKQPSTIDRAVQIIRSFR